jgi:hypothetical protein
MSSLPVRLAKFVRFPWRDKLLFFEAWLRLGWARFSILTVPFPKLVTSWGAPLHETFREEPRDRALVGRVKWAISTASRYTPWKSNCLPQAMSGKRMLQKRGLRSTLYLGLLRERSGNVAAHAWLRCGNVFVTGGRGVRFTVVGTFAEAEGYAPPSTLPVPEVQAAFARLKNEQH